MIFCPKCGTVLDEEDRFCAECGATINYRPHDDHSGNDHDETRFVAGDTILNFGQNPSPANNQAGQNPWNSFPGSQGNALPFTPNTPSGFQGIPGSDPAQGNRTDTIYAPFGQPIGSNDQIQTPIQDPQPRKRNATIVAIVALLAIVLVAGISAYVFIGNNVLGSSPSPEEPVPNPTPNPDPVPEPEPEPVEDNSVKTLTVVGADGTERSAEIHCQGSSERVLPDGNSKYYSESELAALSDAERCIAWNEIIAASNGYCFKNSGLREYFGSCSWYHPVSGASAAGSLSDAGKHNVELLKRMTDSWWLDLATY